MRSSRPTARCRALAAVLLAALSCGGERRAASRAPGAEPLLHVLMVNGGGSRTKNYQSHWLHLRELLAALLEAGVERERVAIFSADGSDPAADLAVRQPVGDGDFWLIERTEVGRRLENPVVYRSSEIPGTVLRPAGREELRSWFAEAAARVAPGDTLLVYVTDHGEKTDDDPWNNRITLWGDSLSVRELRDMLALLDPGVRVMFLMSQCNSGGFAHLVAPAEGALPTGAWCGYFSTTADRLAYGCYPENRGRENVGHSFEFIEALRAGGSFARAHRRVLAADRTPDVPITTSDVFSAKLLDEAAEASGRNRGELGDELLARAWREPRRWKLETRLAAKIRAAFGLPRARFLREAAALSDASVERAGEARRYESAWRFALDDARSANLERFLEARPDWAERLKAGTTEPAQTRAALLAEIGPFTRSDRATFERLLFLRDRTSAAAEVRTRMEAREAAVLRLRAILTRIAAKTHLASDATGERRDASKALERCQELDLGRGGRSEETRPAPFPAYDEDVVLLSRTRPAWIGIRFEQAGAELRSALGLAPGAALVREVRPGSPAEAAGLVPGDVVAGPPGQPFTEPKQIREWTMRLPVGQPASLVVFRDGRRIDVEVVPSLYPAEPPAEPRP